jgi:hypothetical protein
MQLELGKSTELGEVKIGELVIPVKLTMAALAWMQAQGFIASPSLVDIKKFAGQALKDGPVAFLSPLLAGIAIAAKIETSKAAIDEALGASEPLALMKLNVLLQQAILQAYSGPFPEGKGPAVPGSAHRATAKNGTGAKRLSRRRNAK